MTIVWRLETVDGYGVYANGLCNAIREDIDSANLYNIERHLMPTVDRGLRKKWSKVGYDDKDSWFFGFSSLRTYKLWFMSIAIRKWFANYEETKVVLSKYEVPEAFVIKGDTQAVFLRANAVLVEQCRPDIV